MRSTASVTVEKARLFLAQARSADPDDRATTSANLEAAIVFGRSVTFHLQSQFAREPGFDAWYAQQQTLLRGQRLSRFLLEQRNYVLKVGPAIVHRIADIAITESVFVRDEVSVQVIRDQPWWRRSPKILVEDALYPWRQRFRLWRERREPRRAAENAGQSGSVTTSDELHFGEPEWKDTPALELVERHLDALAGIVAEAESRFL
jgi:hypothetical protein